MACLPYVPFADANKYGINRKLLTALEPGTFDALEDAAARTVDSYLKRIGAATPLENPGADIRAYTADILRLKLMFARGVDPSSQLYELAVDAHDKALAALQAMVDGELAATDDDGSLDPTDSEYALVSLPNRGWRA